MVSMEYSKNLNSGIDDYFKSYGSKGGLYYLNIIFINNLEHAFITNINNNQFNGLNDNKLKFDSNSYLETPIRDPHPVETFNLRGRKKSI